MPSRSLPARPDLAQLKRQASELRRAYLDGKRAAAARVAAHHPRWKGQTSAAAAGQPLRIADAQLVLAREYGFDGWPRLKHHVEVGRRVARFTAHPRFDEAVAALDFGDLEKLRGLIASNHELVHARTNLEPPYHYFTAATLLHHLAGNPDRRPRLVIQVGKLPPLPANTVELAHLLLDSGADVNASTLGPNGGTLMGLVITSALASDANLSGPLMALLLERGAKLDVRKPEVLDAALTNHAPRAAEKMIELGAKPDVFAAAGLGRMDLLRACFDGDGRLLSRPRRHGKALTERDAIGLAMLFAYVRKQPEAVDFLLEKNGNWNMIGVNNGTALHRAAWDGDLPTLERLVAKGADVSNRNNPFVSSPFGWANYNKQDAVVQWMREHCALDLHDAVSFNLRDHVEARLREQPASVNTRIDHWEIPQSTPLHWAAAFNREELAALLLEHGADPNILAGHGLTALDVALEKHASEVGALLERRGGQRSADLL